MTQALCLGIAAPLTKFRKGEQLYLVMSCYSQVQLIRSPLRPVRLPDDVKPQHLRIETLTFLVTVGQNGDMVNAADGHGSLGKFLFWAAGALTDPPEMRILETAEIFHSVSHTPVHAGMTEKDHAGILQCGMAHEQPGQIDQDGHALMVHDIITD